MTAKLTKNAPSAEMVMKIASHLKAAEYELLEVLGREPCVLRVSTQGQLVAMQRKLRRLRYAIESEV